MLIWICLSQVTNIKKVFSLTCKPSNLIWQNEVYIYLINTTSPFARSGLYLGTKYLRLDGEVKKIRKLRKIVSTASLFRAQSCVSTINHYVYVQRTATKQKIR